MKAVAINDVGNGIVRGYGDAFASAFAAFVTQGVSPTALSSLPTGSGAIIDSVAINHAGNALIGGG